MILSRFTVSIFALSLLCFSSSSIAFGMFSRACPLSEIPSIVRGPAIILMKALNSRSDHNIDYVGATGFSDWANHWVHESITTDYLSARYYLYAEHQTWFRNCTNGQCTNQLADKYTSDGWTAETVPQGLLTDTSLAVFFANRGFLYSARAGFPGLIVRWSPPSPGTTRTTASTGRHYYYDPVSKNQFFLGATVAHNCNLTEWGFEQR